MQDTISRAPLLSPNGLYPDPLTVVSQLNVDPRLNISNGFSLTSCRL